MLTVVKLRFAQGGLIELFERVCRVKVVNAGTGERPRHLVDDFDRPNERKLNHWRRAIGHSLASMTMSWSLLSTPSRP